MKWHCGVCLYIYKWLGFAVKSDTKSVSQNLITQFCKQRYIAYGNESGRALRLQADDGFRPTCELYSWQSHEQSQIYQFYTKEKRHS